jgi:hypothetical protein
MKINPRMYEKVITKLLEMVEKNDKRIGRLGGPGILVEVDETALNHKLNAEELLRIKPTQCV